MNGMLKEKNPRTEEDSIISYMRGEVEILPEHLDRKRKIYEFIHVQMMGFRSDVEIKDLVQYVFKIKRSQAYEYINYARYVYGNYLRLDKKYSVYRLEQKCLKAIQMAEDKGDVNALIKANDSYQKLLSTLSDEDPNATTGTRMNMMVFNLQNTTYNLNMKHVHRLTEEKRQELLEMIKEHELERNRKRLEQDIDE